MRLEIYAIKDTVVGTFKNPFYLHNVNEAKRILAGQIRQDQELKFTASDYQLWNLGVFDDQTGEIEYKPEYICSLNELVAPATKQIENKE